MPHVHTGGNMAPEGLDDADRKSEDRSFQFHMKEYSALRGQIENHINSMRALERYVVGTLAVLYSWVMTNHHTLAGEAGEQLHVLDPSGLIWFLPVAVVFLGWLRSIALAKRLKMMGKYCRQVETRYSEAGLDGWENVLEAWKPPSGWLSREVLWKSLFFASLVVSLWGFVYHARGPHPENGTSQLLVFSRPELHPDFEPVAQAWRRGSRPNPGHVPSSGVRRPLV